MFANLTVISDVAPTRSLSHNRHVGFFVSEHPQCFAQLAVTQHVAWLTTKQSDEVLDCSEVLRQTSCGSQSRMKAEEQVDARHIPRGRRTVDPLPAAIQ